MRSKHWILIGIGAVALGGTGWHVFGRQSPVSREAADAVQLQDGHADDSIDARSAAINSRPRSARANQRVAALTQGESVGPTFNSSANLGYARVSPASGSTPLATNTNNGSARENGASPDGKVRLRNVMKAPEVSAALAAFQKVCEDTVKRVGKCAGFGANNRTCHPEREGNSAAYDSQSALVRCLEARRRESDCSAKLDCVAFIDWWNRDTPDLCKDERTEVEVNCPESDQR